MGHDGETSEFAEQCSICVRHRTRLPVHVEKTALVYGAAHFRQSDIPVHLIDEAVPREAEHRHAVCAHGEDVGPLFPQPSGRQIRVEQVCFGVHQWFAIAPMVQLGDLIPSEYVFTHDYRPIGEQHALIAPVVVDAKHLKPRRFAAHEPVVLLACQSVIQQIREYVGIRRMRVQEIERQESQFVDQRHRFRRVGMQIVHVLRAFTLYNDAISPASKQAVTRQDAGGRKMLHGGDESVIRAQLLVPQAVVPTQARRDVHLVHGRVVAHPGIPTRYRFGVVCQM